MEVIVGNIWNVAARNDLIVIPTNEGYRSDGRNVMGAGLARQAAAHYPELPRWYGQTIRACWKDTRSVPGVILSPFEGLIMFPTKPFNTLVPALSWKGKSQLAVIEKSATQLAQRFGAIPPDVLASIRGGPVEVPPRILVPLVGCGNGGLLPKEVEPILNTYLGDPFVLVRLP